MDSSSTTNLIDRAYGYTPEINYLVVGPQGCGKSTFLERITLGKIGGESFRVPHKPYVLKNNAQENAPILNFYEDEFLDSEYKHARPDVVVLCFDVTDLTKFDELPEMNRVLPKIYGADLTSMVLGLKRDLRDGKAEGEYIDPMLGYKAAQLMDTTGYMECSAVTEDLVPLVVEDLVKRGINVKVGKVNGEAGETGMGNCTMM